MISKWFWATLFFCSEIGTLGPQKNKVSSYVALEILPYLISIRSMICMVQTEISGSEYYVNICIFESMRQIVLWCWKEYLTHRFESVNIYIIFYGCDSSICTIQIKDFHKLSSIQEYRCGQLYLSCAIRNKQEKWSVQKRTAHRVSKTQTWVNTNKMMISILVLKRRKFPRRNLTYRITILLNHILNREVLIATKIQYQYFRNTKKLYYHCCVIGPVYCW